MTQTSVLHIFLIALLLLSGCNGLSNTDNTAAPTVTPADLPTNEPSAVWRLAPGLITQGIVDPLALSNAHTKILSNTSYTYQINRTEIYPNGTIRARTGTNVQVVAPTNHYYSAHDVIQTQMNTNHVAQRTEYWSDGKQVFIAESRENNTTFTQYGSPIPPSLQPSFSNKEWFYSLFSSVEMRIINRTASKGTRRYRLELTNVTSPDGFNDVITYENANVENVEFNVSIDSNGVIHKYRLAYTVADTSRTTHINSTIRVIKSGRYSNIGSTAVKRPSWYSAANQTTPIHPDVLPQ